MSLIKKKLFRFYTRVWITRAQGRAERAHVSRVLVDLPVTPPPLEDGEPRSPQRPVDGPQASLPV